jgi:hypothetical protein
MNNHYKGQEGALKFIVDIADGYDGCNTVDSLNELSREQFTIICIKEE